MKGNSFEPLIVPPERERERNKILCGATFFLEHKQMDKILYVSISSA